MTRAATYIRTDPEGELPSAQEQRKALEAYAAREEYQISTSYEDLRAPGNGRMRGFIVLDTLYLLLGIIGFFAVIAAFFFGGFVILDFLFSRFSREP